MSVSDVGTASRCGVPVSANVCHAMAGIGAYLFLRAVARFIAMPRKWDGEGPGGGRGKPGEGALDGRNRPETHAWRTRFCVQAETGGVLRIRIAYPFLRCTNTSAGRAVARARELVSHERPLRWPEAYPFLRAYPARERCEKPACDGLRGALRTRFCACGGRGFRRPAQAAAPGEADAYPILRTPRRGSRQGDDTPARTEAYPFLRSSQHIFGWVRRDGGGGKGGLPFAALGAFGTRQEARAVPCYRWRESASPTRAGQKKPRLGRRGFSTGSHSRRSASLLLTAA